jgi:hypothetical protein
MAELPDRDRLAVVRAAPLMTTRAGRPVTILSVRRTIGQVSPLIDRQQRAGAIRVTRAHIAPTGSPSPRDRPSCCSSS